MNRQEILDRASKAVNGERDQQYGSPEDNFAVIAAYWTVHLRARYGLDITIDSGDVAIMSGQIKDARLANDITHEDSWVDKVGYGACGGEVATREPVND